MGVRVRGRANAGMDCHLCGRPLMAHGLTEFCREGRSRPPTPIIQQTVVYRPRRRPDPLVATDPSIAIAIAESFPDFDREERRAGTLLIGALGCGPVYAKLRQYTGVPWHSTLNCGYYFRRAGIWQGRLMNYPWLEPYLAGEPEGTLGFVLDVQVGVGMVDRMLIDGEPHYRAAELMAGQGFTRYDFFKLHPRKYQKQKLAA